MLNYKTQKYMSTKTTVFIDGSFGTTGLGIASRLSQSHLFNLLSLKREESKNSAKKKAMLQQCDIAVLCLPDNAATETVSLIKTLAESEQPKILDASSAFRTNPNWAYGFDELHSDKSILRNARLVSNPGCYALAFIAILHPLISEGVVSPNYPYVAFGASGYSGGGKGLIEKVEHGFNPLHSLYAMELQHKHIPEMQMHSGLVQAPIFQPVVVNAYSGMVVSVALPKEAFVSASRASQNYSRNATTLDDFNGESKLEWENGEQNNNQQLVLNCLHKYYEASNNSFQEDKNAQKNRVQITEFQKPHLENGYFPFTQKANSDHLEIFVAGNHQNIMIHAVLCNLGIGASGNAMHNLLLMSGNL